MLGELHGGERRMRTLPGRVGRVRSKRPTTTVGTVSTRSAHDDFGSHPSTYVGRLRLIALTIAGSLVVGIACGSTESADEPLANQSSLDRSPTSPDTAASLDDGGAAPTRSDEAIVDEVPAPSPNDEANGDVVDLTDLSELVYFSPIILRGTLPSPPTKVTPIDGGPVDVGFDAVSLRDLTISEVLKDDPNRFQADLTPRLSTQPGDHQIGLPNANDSEAIAALSGLENLDVLLFLAGIGDPDVGVLAPSGGTLGVFLIEDELLEPVADAAAFTEGTSFDEARRQIEAAIQQHAQRTVLEDPSLEVVQQALDMPRAVEPEGWTIRQTGRTTFDFATTEAPASIIVAVCAAEDQTGSIITDVCDVRDAVVVDVDNAEPAIIDVPVLAEGKARLGTGEVLECADVQCWLVVVSSADLAQRRALPIDQ